MKHLLVPSLSLGGLSLGGPSLAGLSLAMVLLAAPVSAPVFAQVTDMQQGAMGDATFDIETTDPEIEAELTETEAELDEFFADAPDFRPDVRFTPDADARTEQELLRRAQQEMGEFNDIDDDDLAEAGRLRTEAGLPRLEKPGQVEKDFAIDCPAGTTRAVDGLSCVAGPDWVFD